jgi:predicted Zn-dependent protease
MMTVRTWFGASKECRSDRRRNAKSTARALAAVRPAIEDLESRVVLYTTTGNLWPSPQLITISFMPDGTNVNGYSSNLFASLNANSRFGSTAAWQNAILKAAQSWAAQTNINFAVVPDNGTPEGSGNYQQGDPGFGDIRIGGYAFNNPALAVAYAPPPVNNYSVAGDITFNTNQVFTNGTTGNDLFTIAAHEFGHALGLGHSTVPDAGYAEMYSVYNGVKPNLYSDDIAGIRSIYSGGAARSPDAFDQQAGLGDSFDNPVGMNVRISYPTMTYLVTGADITTTDDAGYYLVNAPPETTSTMTVQVQSKGLSLLSPTMTVYANDRTTVLASVSGLNQYGTILTATVTRVTPGTPYFIKVTGADTSVFSTGAYALALSFSTTAPPIASSPNTKLANGNPLQAGGGIADSLQVAPELLKHEHKHGHNKVEAKPKAVVHAHVHAHPGTNRPWHVARHQAVATLKVKHG